VDSKHRLSNPRCAIHPPAQFLNSVLADNFYLIFIVAVSEKTSTGNTEYAEQVQNHQDDHDQSEDSDASTPTPSTISVIASAATEQE